MHRQAGCAARPLVGQLHDVAIAEPDGLLGRHDKDLPTMWENDLYALGHDDGLLHAHMPARRGRRAGQRRAAPCWELTRSCTVRRLAGLVDLALAGSGS